MSIILAKKTECSAIIQLLKRCAIDLEKQHIFQWNEAYPSLEVIKKDIHLKQLHLLKNGSKIIGSIVLSEIKDTVYNSVTWKNDTHKALYIHRLAIDPEEQQKGYAQQLMAFAENYARTQHYETIRLDTFSQNKRNQRFYSQRGYQHMGDIYLPTQSMSPFYCFEKLIISTSNTIS
ncbi:MAG: GNAT family N-acetyltransferase [Flavobacteriaceae bacterium]|nr:MAG: GNAT family N-acetyltransferase [Flavobacteriaceae bacterium]